jgi:hypothetical protein
MKITSKVKWDLKLLNDYTRGELEVEMGLIISLKVVLLGQLLRLLSITLMQSLVNMNTDLLRVMIKALLVLTQMQVCMVKSQVLVRNLPQ